MTLVMVVDDDQDLAEMLGIVLTGAGMDVDLVSRAMRSWMYSVTIHQI